MEVQGGTEGRIQLYTSSSSINGGLPISATLTKFSAHPSSTPVNLHEVDFATTRAYALDLGFRGVFGFIKFIKLLVCILQRLLFVFSNNIGFWFFHL